MKKGFAIVSLVWIGLAGLFFQPAFAFQERIKNIIEQPESYQNQEVTLVGQVLNATSDPEGTTQGFYTFIDESCTENEKILIRTSELPPVGKMFKITGVVSSDPEDGSSYIQETSRSAPGIPSWVTILLIGAGVLFVALLIVLVVILVKPKVLAKSPITVRPADFKPEPIPAMGHAPSRPVDRPPAQPPSLEPDKTRVFLSLRADVIVEKGLDEGKSYPLHKLITTVGRQGARRNDVELTDDTVSKEQATIFYDNASQEFSIRNESTTNPTHVNKKIVTDSVILQNNDLIDIGASTLRFKKET